MRNDDKIFEMLKNSEALLEGHFVLSSGLHSNKYIQCAKLTQYPVYCNFVAEKLAGYYKDEKIDIVIGGAFGGIVIAYEIARVLGVRNVFAERVDGEFALRRGFSIKEGEKVLIAEDVCTTGKSIKEVANLVKEYKGDIVGCAVIIDRGQEAGKALGMRKEWALSVKAEAWKEEDLPEEIRILPIEKPGSRFNK